MEEVNKAVHPPRAQLPVKTESRKPTIIHEVRARRSNTVSYGSPNSHGHTPAFGRPVELSPTSLAAANARATMILRGGKSNKVKNTHRSTSDTSSDAPVRYLGTRTEHMNLNGKYEEHNRRATRDMALTGKYSENHRHVRNTIATVEDTAGLRRAQTRIERHRSAPESQTGSTKRSGKGLKEAKPKKEKKKNKKKNKESRRTSWLFSSTRRGKHKVRSRSNSPIKPPPVRMNNIEEEPPEPPDLNETMIITSPIKENEDAVDTQVDTGVKEYPEPEDEEKLAQLLKEEIEKNKEFLAPNQVNRDGVKAIKVIGAGQFGKVYIAKHYVTDSEMVPCAVKVVVGSPDDEKDMLFLREAAILAPLTHPAINKMQGVCLKARPWLCVLEYVRYGDLRKNLLACGKKKFRLLLVEQLHMCIQIADGMKYLHENRIVHRDLAARNILLGSNCKVKIADFGHARKYDNGKDSYRMYDSQRMSIKWTALEIFTVLEKKFNEMTDVWSYGVTIWEIFSYAGKPYHFVKAEKVPRAVKSGLRLTNPGCPPQLYKLMSSCWIADPDQRPSFTDLRRSLIKRQHEAGGPAGIRDFAKIVMASIKSTGSAKKAPAGESSAQTGDSDDDGDDEDEEDVTDENGSESESDEPAVTQLQRRGTAPPSMGKSHRSHSVKVSSVSVDADLTRRTGLRGRLDFEPVAHESPHPNFRPPAPPSAGGTELTKDMRKEIAQVLLRQRGSAKSIRTPKGQPRAELAPSADSPALFWAKPPAPPDA